MGVGDAVGRAVAAPKRVAVGFWRGLTYPFEGFRFVFFQHPGLVRYWIFPLVITLVTLGLVVKGVWHYHDALFEALWQEPSGEDFWAGVARFFHGVVEILFAIALFVAGLVLVVLLSSAFAAPFNDLLSEEVERLVTGRGGPPFSVRVVLADLGRTLLFEGLYMVVAGGLWVASLVAPLIGQIAVGILSFFITGLYWGISYIDWPASRRRRTLGFRLAMGVRHFLSMTGFGTGVWVILFIPLVNLLFMPAAVAGGTLLYLDLECRDGLEPNPQPSP